MGQAPAEDMLAARELVGSPALSRTPRRGTLLADVRGALGDLARSCAQDVLLG